MKKLKIFAALLFVFMFCMSLNKSVFAGEWIFDGPKNWQWWYKNDDGSYPHDAWSNINGKWYHFDSDGYLDVGYREIDGKCYILEEQGSKIGQMRENEKHRTYSVAADGQVHMYELAGYPSDNEGFEELYFKETGEKLFAILKEFGMYTDADYYIYSLESYVYSSYYTKDKQQKPEDIEFFNKNFTQAPSYYEVDVINVKEQNDIYDYIVLIDWINDGLGQSFDYNSVFHDGGDYLGNCSYMYIDKDKAKIFIYY